MKRLLAFALLALSVGPLLSAEVTDLVKQLKSRDPDERRAAAKKLTEAGSEAKGAGPALIFALKDKDLYVRRYAAEALGKIESDPKKTIPALTLALRDTKKQVQEAAAISLGGMGPNAIPALVATLKDPEKEPSVRGKAAEALGKIGPAAKSALPALIEALGGAAATKAPKKGPAPAGDIRLELVNAVGEIATAEDKGAISTLASVGTAARRDRTLQQATSKAIKQIQARK